METVTALRNLDREIEARGGPETSADTERRHALELELTRRNEAHEAAMNADAEDARFAKAYTESGGHRTENRSARRPADQRAEEFLRAYRVGEELRADDFGFGLEERAALFASSTAARGSDTVPTSIGQMVESRVSIAGLLDRGLNVLRTASGESIHIPRGATRSQFSRVAEGATIPKSDPTLAGVDLGAFKYAAIAQASFEYLTDADIDVTRLVGKSFGDSADVLLERLVVTGSDGSNDIAGGIVDSANVADLAAVDAITADEVVDAYFALPAAYRRDAVFVFSSTALQAIRKLKASGSGEYLMDWTGPVPTILGAPVLQSPFFGDLEADTVVGAFMVPESYTLRMAGGLTIVRSDEYGFDEDLASWKARIRCDGSLTDPAGCVTVKTAAS